MGSDDSVEVTAPSVEEAIIVGLTRLMATRDEVEIEVLDEGSHGFLGIGSREAKVRLVRASRPPVTTAAPATRPISGSAVAVEPTSGELKAPETSEQVPEPSPVVVPVVADEGPVVAAAEESASAEAAPAHAEPEVPGRADQGGQAVGEPVPHQTTPQQRTPPSDGLDRANLAAIAEDIMAHMLPGMDVTSTVEWIDEDRPTLWVSLAGKDADALVGPRARNLHSVQYLFRALIYHRVDGDYNVVVDADGYRRRRRRSLESMAQAKADEAVEKGQTVRLRPMPAHERRIIHIVLRDDERVTTESVGKGQDRAVTIVPVSHSEADRR